MPAWGQQPHQIGSLAINQSASAGPQLIAILRPRDTSWVAPKTSKYTFYVWGAGGIPATVGAGAGGFARKTISLTKGTALTSAISFGGVYSPDSSQNSVSTTTLSGPGISISCGAGNNATGGNATGGDVNVPGTNGVGQTGGAAGGDGTPIGTGGTGGPNGTPGTHPGGGSGSGGGIISYSGSGEIRIVDETP